MAIVFFFSVWPTYRTCTFCISMLREYVYMLETQVNSLPLSLSLWAKISIPDMHSPIVVRSHPQKGLLHTLTPHNEQEEHVRRVKVSSL